MKKLLLVVIVCIIFIFVLVFTAYNRGPKIDKISMIGRYLKAVDNTNNIIIDETGSPIVMGNETGNKDIFKGLKTGDKIEIICDSSITESYPGGTTIYDLIFIEEGSKEDIPKGTLDNLKGMGWNLDLS